MPVTSLTRVVATSSRGLLAGISMQQLDSLLAKGGGLAYELMLFIGKLGMALSQAWCQAERGLVKVDGQKVLELARKHSEKRRASMKSAGGGRRRRSLSQGGVGALALPPGFDGLAKKTAGRKVSPRGVADSVSPPELRKPAGRGAGRRRGSVRSAGPPSPMEGGGLGGLTRGNLARLLEGQEEAQRESDQRSQASGSNQDDDTRYIGGQSRARSIVSSTSRATSHRPKKSPTTPRRRQSISSTGSSGGLKHMVVPAAAEDKDDISSASDSKSAAGGGAKLKKRGSGTGKGLTRGKMMGRRRSRSDDAMDLMIEQIEEEEEQQIRDAVNALITMLEMAPPEVSMVSTAGFTL